MRGVCGTCNSTIDATENDTEAHSYVHPSKLALTPHAIEERPRDRVCIAPYSAHKYLYLYSVSAAVANITALRYINFPRIAPARAPLLRR